MSTFSQTLRVNPDLIPQDYGPQSSGIVDGSQAGIFLLINLSKPGVPNFVGVLLGFSYVYYEYAHYVCLCYYPAIPKPRVTEIRL